MNYANQVMQFKSSSALWGRVRRVVHAFLATVALAALSTPAQAQLKIDITGVGANQIAFSAAPFQGNQGLPEDIKKIIEDEILLNLPAFPKHQHNCIAKKDDNTSINLLKDDESSFPENPFSILAKLKNTGDL